MDRLRPFGVSYVPGCRGNLTVYTVNTYFSNVSVPNVTYYGRSFLFLSPYTLRVENFYIDAQGWLAYSYPWNFPDVLGLGLFWYGMKKL